MWDLSAPDLEIASRNPDDAADMRGQELESKIGWVKGDILSLPVNYSDAS